MNKCYVFLVLLILNCTLFAQISVKYATPNNTRAWQIIKKNNGNYLVVIHEIDRTQSPSVGFTKIFEMNPVGRFVDSTILKNTNQDTYLYRIIPLSNGYMGLGTVANKLDSRQFFSVTRFDKFLKRIQDTVVPVAKNIDIPSFALDRDSNIILAVANINSNNYFGKIDRNGNIKSWKLDTTGLNFSSNSIIIRKDSGLYTIHFFYRFVTFDTAFNKIHESSNLFGNTVIGLGATVIPLNDSIIVIAGKGANPTSGFNGWRHLFGVTTLSGREIFKNIYSTNVDTTIWGAGVNCVDTSKSGEWFWGGTHNWIIASSGLSSASSSFLLHKLNRNYTTKWTKKYGGDAYYEMYGVLAKDDGGCLMYGTRYDYNNTPKYDAYILNVDADGLVTSESFIPLSLHPLSIFPNPSNGLVNFDYKEPLKDIQIRVVDAKGSLVHQLKMPDGVLPSLDLSFLNNGVYFIQIMEQNRLFSVSRWVKGL
jgi:hypothetical protein